MASKPKTFKKLMVQKLTSNFREAVSIETVNMCHPQKGEVCVRNKYVGINATDINSTKGRYMVSGKVPFGVGFEAVGEIVEIGENVENFEVGQNVAYIDIRCSAYAEYVCVPVVGVYAIPKIIPDYLGLLIAGQTAAKGLDRAARITSGETVLITAAAGGTGHIAVQWAKAVDCHVIGTCSSEEKEKVLKDLGCDRIINYKKEDLGEVLAKEYPKGVNVVWETIGGKVFTECLKNLALRGRLLVVGGITGYKNESKEALPKVDLSGLNLELLYKSATVQGFFLAHYPDEEGYYFKYLSESLEKGKLTVVCDNGEKTTGSEFLGVEGIIKAVEHLHSGKNIGKVVARVY